ncbi:hypothetical protein CSW98_16465 [Vibrio sp. HA2012]|nr:hypothetical protein CSW98_16465 [Vibrio sp. HA2012]
MRLAPKMCIDKIKYEPGNRISEEAISSSGIKLDRIIKFHYKILTIFKIFISYPDNSVFFCLNSL